MEHIWEIYENIIGNIIYGKYTGHMWKIYGGNMWEYTWDKVCID